MIAIAHPGLFYLVGGMLFVASWVLVMMWIATTPPRKRQVGNEPITWNQKKNRFESLELPKRPTINE